MAEIMRVAELTGRSEAGAAGMVWYPNFQLTHALCALRRARPDDNKAIRLRRHNLILGPRGFLKTSATKRFLYDLAGGISLAKAKDDDFTQRGPDGRITNVGHPIILELGGRTTMERAGGSFDGEGEVVWPLFPQADYWFTGELMDWLGRKQDELQARMDNMNVLLEEGTYGINLVKGSSVKDPASLEARLRSNLRTAKVWFSEFNRILEYETRGFFVGCTYDAMPQADKDTLSNSGFMSRVNPLNWAHSNTALKSMWESGVRRDDFSAAKIANFNSTLWSLDVRRVDTPPIDMQRSVLREYAKFYDAIEDQTKHKTSETRSMRDWTDVIQLIVGMATLRVAESHHTDGSDPVDAIESGAIPVESLDYTPSDAESAKDFLAKHMRMRQELYVAVAKDDPMAVKDMKALTGFLHDHGGVQEFTGPAFVKWFTSNVELRKGKKPSVSSAYHHLSKMQERGWVIQLSGSLEYSVDDAFIMLMQRNAPEDIEVEVVDA